MSLVPPLPDHARSTIERFLRAHTIDDGAAGAAVGLSGGIDSALVARLAVDALGPDHVVGVFSPDAAYPAELGEDVRRLATALGIELVTVRLDGIETALHSALPSVTDPTAWGNVRARVRMVVLYAVARERALRVAGTGNKSELLLGYFTKYGDGGVDLLPIGDLYKTQVRALAAERGLPPAILERPPSAGLWEGQTDEAELGLPYARLDPILAGIERLMTPEAIATATGESVDRIVAIEARILLHRHKRRPAPIPKIGTRTIGLDWKD